jgi:hypothetical protein
MSADPVDKYGIELGTMINRIQRSIGGMGPTLLVFVSDPSPKRGMNCQYRHSDWRKTPAPRREAFSEHGDGVGLHHGIESSVAPDKLLQVLQGQSFVLYEGNGIPDQEGWAPERSVLIAGISRHEALEIGARFGQNVMELRGWSCGTGYIPERIRIASRDETSRSRHYYE